MGNEDADDNEVILGFDPGLTDCGFAVMIGNDIVDSGLIGVKPIKKKANLHFACDFSVRLEMLSRRIRKIMRCHKPDIVVYEAVSMLRSATSSAKLWSGAAAVISQCVAWNIPLRPVLHEEVDEWLGESNLGRSQRKAEIRKKVEKEWPNHEWPRKPRKRTIIQHAADAAAVAAAARRLKLIKVRW